MHKEILINGMLVENTGIAMMDSGGDHNRAWQRNQGKTLADFEAEPQVTYNIDKDVCTLTKDGKYIRYGESENELLIYLQKYQPQSVNHAMKYEGYKIECKPLDSSCINYTISVFHYLNQLELDDICNEFNVMPCSDWDSDIYGVSEIQKAWLLKQGFEIGDSFNTYNDNSSLSQVLQGTYVTLNTDHYVLLQVHGGADVRGGYTDAKMFYLPNDYMPSEDVEGDIDGIPVSNSYDGYTLHRYDMDMGETNELVPLKKDSVIKLTLREY
jgi:hypothetical protein